MNQTSRDKILIFKDQIFNHELSFNEEYLLELKIYQPYFITNSTIIQLQGNKTLNIFPEKLSIMEILESHFLENKNKSSLFFKVNLGDLNEIQILQHIDRSRSRQFSGLLDESNSMESQSPASHSREDR